MHALFEPKGIAEGTAAVACLHDSIFLLHVCSALFEPGGSLHGKASEKGLLQLLFDVRFLWDALSGGRPLGDPQPEPPSNQPPTR